MSNSRSSTSAAVAAPHVTKIPAASATAILRTNVGVALLLELHDAHHPALRQVMGAGRQLIKGDLEGFHRIAAGLESHPLRLEPLQRLLELGVHGLGHEVLEGRAVDDQLERLDVMTAPHALDI